MVKKIISGTLGLVAAISFSAAAVMPAMAASYGVSKYGTSRFGKTQVVKKGARLRKNQPMKKSPSRPAPRKAKQKSRGNK